MKLSIEEQKKFLFDRLKTEPLRKTKENKEDIKAFVQTTKGEKISSYLINNAWDDDCDRNTKVFLVRDQETKEIVFFYAINCGILFSELNIWNLSKDEKIPFDKYVGAMQRLMTSNLSKEDRADIFRRDHSALPAGVLCSAGAGSVNCLQFKARSEVSTWQRQPDKRARCAG